MKELDNEDQKRQNISKDIFNLIKLIKQGNMLPAICFSFNRRRCEELAQLFKDYSLITENEKEIINKVWTKGIKTLSIEDQDMKSIS